MRASAILPEMTSRSPDVNQDGGCVNDLNHFIENANDLINMYISAMDLIDMQIVFKFLNDGAKFKNLKMARWRTY